MNTITNFFINKSNTTRPYIYRNLWEQLLDLVGEALIEFLVDNRKDNLDFNYDNAFSIDINRVNDINLNDLTINFIGPKSSYKELILNPRNSNFNTVRDLSFQREINMIPIGNLEIEQEKNKQEEITIYVAKREVDNGRQSQLSIDI